MGPPQKRPLILRGEEKAPERAALRASFSPEQSKAQAVWTSARKFGALRSSAENCAAPALPGRSYRIKGAPKRAQARLGNGIHFRPKSKMHLVSLGTVRKVHLIFRQFHRDPAIAGTGASAPVNSEHCAAVQRIAQPRLCRGGAIESKGPQTGAGPFGKRNSFPPEIQNALGFLRNCPKSAFNFRTVPKEACPWLFV